jgi:fatty acid desaturase
MDPTGQAEAGSDRRGAPPPPASLQHLTASDAKGLAFTAATAVVTGTGLALSIGGGVPSWVLGQTLLGFAFVQWFVLLHECGHRTLFRTRTWNAVTGHVAAVCSLIPLVVWTHVHRQHHKWTGWQDLDPTTASLAPRARTSLECAAVRVCWRCWIPLFALAYRLGNFWNVPRLLRVQPSALRRRLLAGLLGQATLYAGLAWWLGPMPLLRLAGAATLMSFVIEDLLLISQHTHVPMALGAGHHVTPHRALDQERFTRSLRFPRPLGGIALNVDAHELHHMYPFVPGYRLREIPYHTGNEVGWWRWVRAARAVPGDVLLFQNRHDTGLEL